MKVDGKRSQSQIKNGNTPKFLRQTLKYSHKLTDKQLLIRMDSGNVMTKLGFQYEKDIPYECNDGTVIREGIQCRFYNLKV